MKSYITICVSVCRWLHAHTAASARTSMQLWRVVGGAESEMSASACTCCMPS